MVYGLRVRVPKRNTQHQQTSDNELKPKGAKASTSNNCQTLQNQVSISNQKSKTKQSTTNKTTSKPYTPKPLTLKPKPKTLNRKSRAIWKLAKSKAPPCRGEEESICRYVSGFTLIGVSVRGLGFKFCVFFYGIYDV
jgi:hypothetical protein